ncbi:MAG TPA: hypothetical protein VFX70_00660 [Mycobacteriales bacterium]|nr:hypothetical protein [Mycobacteriales bacterium]
MSQRRCEERVVREWGNFAERRRQRLSQRDRYGKAAEKVTEQIVEDLLTTVLDWPLSSLNFQVGYADILLTSLNVKYLVIETKRPGALSGHGVALRSALDQACRYAAEQKVRCVAISDGDLFYSADVVHGGLRDRVFVRLTDLVPPAGMWWVSVHGIYRPVAERPGPPVPPVQAGPAEPPADGLLTHPKYHLPAACFGYVGSADRPGTWKLPYLLADGAVDARRLPKAIQAILSNYRGLKVGSVPESAVPDVLVRLGRAAVRVGRMPPECDEPAPIYQQLADVLDQLGRLDDIRADQPDVGTGRSVSGTSQ